MKIKFYFIFWAYILVLGLSQSSFAQRFPVIIQGNVLDAETNKPIQNVNVFLSGTTVGTSTGPNGKYTIRDSVLAGKYSLVYSHVGYNTQVKELMIVQEGTLQEDTLRENILKVDMLLIPKQNTLSEVVVKAKKDLVWQKQLQVFQREFLGTSSMGKQCKILNPWVLSFNQSRDTLMASAPKEVIVENQALGYKIYCDLVAFHHVNFFTTYLAYYRFEALKPQNNKQARKWNKARLQAFYGSFRHFSIALLHDRLKKEGFKIKYSKLSPEAYTPEQPLTPIQPQKLHSKNHIILPDYLSITYRKREEMEFIKSIISQGKKIRARARFSRALPQNSWISIKGGKLKVSDLGLILDNPLKLQTYGYWAWQRVGNRLPTGFIPERLNQAIQLSKIGKVKQLQRYVQRHPQEKVYLHQDKPYYALGDTVWVSGYVVQAQNHNPSNLSRVLYVDLIDPNGQLKQQLKLKVEKGKAAGDFTLDTAYVSGTYRLQAYTKLMATDHQDYLFQREFEVGQVTKQSLTGNITYKSTTANGQQSIRYTLTLQDQFRQTLNDQDFDLLIRTNQKVYRQQRLKTNAQGIIQGSLDIPASESSSHLEFIAKNKAKATQRFYISIGHPIKQVRFFPEGGHLITGVPSQVAFKAINHQGLGVKVRGRVINQVGEEITTFESAHLGMGKFTFTPQKSAQYTVIVSSGDGSKQQFKLPQALPQGFVLNVYPISQNQSKLRLQSPRRKRTKFIIIAHCRGKSVYTASGIVKRNRPFEAIIKHDQLPSGILTFTVFDESFAPQCERLVFSRNHLQDLQINLNAPPRATLPREQVTLQIDVGNQPNANLSIAVVDESLVQHDAQQTHILSHLLLTSDIKGYIEQPNFYFKDEKLATRKALDLLMMTQGWRRFTWQQVNTNHRQTSKQLIEKSLKIQGMVTKPSGKPVAGASVTLLSLDQKVTKITQTRDDGRFSFDHLQLYKGDRLVFKALTANGKTKLKVKLDTTLSALNIKPLPLASRSGINATQADPKTLYIQHQAKQLQIRKSLQPDISVKMLEEVQVKAKRITGQQYSQRTIQLYSQPSYRVRVDSGHFKARDGDLFMNYIQGKIPSLKVYRHNTGRYMLTFRGSELNAAWGGNPEIMYLLDGQPVDSEVLSIIDLSNIAYIDMVSPAKASLYASGSSGGSGTAMNGVLAIYTKKDYTHSKIFRYRGIKSILYQYGFDQASQFYVPPYDNPAFAKSRLPDYRSTIYWNPAVKVVNGKARVSFFNAESVTKYRVIIEGISNTGQVGRMIHRYRVKSKE